MMLTALKIVSAIWRGSKFANTVEYDKADIGAAAYGTPLTPGFIPGIAADLSQTQVLYYASTCIRLLQAYH